MKPQEEANRLMQDASQRFPFMDLETLQMVVLYRIEALVIEGDIINEFYYTSLKNFILSYERI